jgi:hypothetical protein
MAMTDDAGEKETGTIYYTAISILRLWTLYLRRCNAESEATRRTVNSKIAKQTAERNTLPKKNIPIERNAPGEAPHRLSIHRATALAKKNNCIPRIYDLFYPTA